MPYRDKRMANHEQEEQYATKDEHTEHKRFPKIQYSTNL